MKKQRTIGSVVRNIRNILHKFVDDDKFKLHYNELHTLFDEIETKAKVLYDYKSEHEESELRNAARRMAPREMIITYHLFGESESTTYRGTHLCLLDAINQVTSNHAEKVFFDSFIEM